MSPQDAARAEEIDQQRAHEGDYEKPAPAAGFVAVGLAGFIIAGCIAVAVAG